MPKRKTPATGLPYTLPSLDTLLRTDPTTFTPRPALFVNEFFLIEILLRSPKAWEAHRKGALEFTRFFQSHRIHFQNPLKGSHHALLTVPPDGLVEELTELGDVDSLLGIQDLGVVARLRPGTEITRGNTTSRWTEQGEETCLGYLRHPSPRFVHLRFDAEHSASAILKSTKLRRLLEERHKLSQDLPRTRVRLLQRPSSNVNRPKVLYDGPVFAFTDRQKRETRLLRHIKEWLQYLQCYDLHQSDHTIKEIADRVYGSARGALHTVSKAIARVKAAIEVAESGSWPPTDIK